MAVVNTTYTPLNFEENAAAQAEKDAQFGDITADLSNQILSGDMDLTGLANMSATDLYNPNHWFDMWNEDESHFMHSEHWRSGGGMDNASNSHYMGHSYVGDDGRRYRKIVTYDKATESLVEEYTNERMYRWSPSDEHKRTHRDSDVAQAAYGKEFQGGGGSGWYTEAEIKAAWDAGDMRQMQEQGVTWDQYWGYVTGIDDLVFAGELDYKDASGWMQNESYKALVNGLGIPMQFENRGDIYNFNGFGYSRDYWSEKSDAPAVIKGLMQAAVGAATGNLFGGLINQLGNATIGFGGWGSTPIGQIIGGVTTGAGAGIGAYEGYNQNPNVIVNLAGTPSNASQVPINPVDEVTPTNPEDLLEILRDLYPDLFRGGGGTGGGGNPGKYYPGTEYSEDLWDLHDYQNLPEGYVLSEDGKYVTGPDGERYPVYYGMYGARVFLPKNKDPEGGGGGSSGGGGGETSDSTTMSQEEADAMIQQMIESGLYGQELVDAIMDAGITDEQVSNAIQSGILTGRDMSNDPDKWDRMNNENAPNLVIYDGRPELLDPDGVWEPAGQGWDGDSLDENGKPRKYYVWKNKETGETWIMYEDELGEYEGAYDFEAYIEEKIPDLTDEERRLIEKLKELGQPIGEILRDIIASRDDLNKKQGDETNPAEVTITLPDGTQTTITNPNYDPNQPSTTNNQVGQPCNIGGKYDGVIVEAPSGALVCSIDFDTNFPDPKDGDTCEMPDGSAGTYKDGVCVANDPTNPTTPGTGTGTNPNPNDPKPGDSCIIGGKEGVFDENLVCQISENPNPTGPQPGDSCTTADGQPGTVDGNGVCQVNQNPDLSGKPCTMPDGSAGTTDADGVCQVNNSPNNTGGQACTMPDGSAGTTDANGVCQPNNPGPKPGDACTTADGQQGTIGQDGVTCETGNGGSGKPCILPDGTVGVTDENGVCKGLGNGPGPGDGPGDGPGEGNGNGVGGGMLSGGGSSVTKNGPLFPYHQFRKFQYAPPPEPTLGIRLFDELFKG